MSFAAVIAFAVSFVCGPALCALLLRLPARLSVLLALALGVVLSMGAALWIDLRQPVAALALMWLGWVLAVALVAQALYRRAGPRFRRPITIVALLTTPLPWFGLATAQLMTLSPG